MRLGFGAKGATILALSLSTLACTSIESVPKRSVREVSKEVRIESNPAEIDRFLKTRNKMKLSDLSRQK